MAEEEGHQEGPDVGAVHVRVRQQDDLVVPRLADLEVLSDVGADRGDQGLYLLIVEGFGQPSLLHVQYLAPDGKHRLELGVPPVLRRTGPPSPPPR